MKVDTRPRHKNSGRPAEKDARGFLQWLRGRQCLAVGSACKLERCEGRMEAAHVDYAGDKGMGTKVSDRYAVPLCTRHHALQHRNGWRWFDGVYLGAEGSALRAAAGYWRAWPGRAKWEREHG